MTGSAPKSGNIERVPLVATRWARVLLGAFLVALCLVVLLPSADHAALGLAARIARYIADWGLPYSAAFAVVEFVSNIVLFVPLGLLMPVAIGSFSGRVLVATVAMGCAVSLGIELLQRNIPGRVSDPRDLLSNTPGTLAGVLVIFAWARLRAWRNSRAAILV